MISVLMLVTALYGSVYFSFMLVDIIEYLFNKDSEVLNEQIRKISEYQVK